VRSLTSSSVLTMTRLRGRPLVQSSSSSSSSSSASSLNSLDGLSSPDEDAESAVALENAAVVALAAWSQSVAECAFFHADVHGGNLLLLGKSARL